MMASPRVVARRLLKRQIFLAAKQIEVADRRLVVCSLQYRIFGDANIAPDAKWICREPAGRQHDCVHIILRSNQGDVDWVSWMSVAGKRDVRRLVDPWVGMGVAN